MAKMVYVTCLCTVFFQILLLRLYARRHRPVAAADTTVDDDSVSNDAPAVAQCVDPLDGLDDSTRITFQVRFIIYISPYGLHGGNAPWFIC